MNIDLNLVWNKRNSEISLIQGVQSQSRQIFCPFTLELQTISRIKVLVHVLRQRLRWNFAELSTTVNAHNLQGGFPKVYFLRGFLEISGRFSVNIMSFKE